MCPGGRACPSSRCSSSNYCPLLLSPQYPQPSSYIATHLAIAARVPDEHALPKGIASGLVVGRHRGTDLA